MKVKIRSLISPVHSIKIEGNKYIITRHKFPEMKILYDPKRRMGSVIQKEPNVPEAKIQEAFFKAIDWAKDNVTG